MRRFCFSARLIIAACCVACVAGRTLTFYFPTVDSPPKVNVAGDTAVVGKQKVSLKDGNLVLTTKGR